MNRHTVNPAHRAAPPRHLVDALFDFEALPGRYPLTLREPRALFDRSRDVLVLAAGRAVPGLALESVEVARAQKAACFFIRTALLRPGADHYTLLGLEPGFHKDALRNHYRMLMRLTHPDFAAASSAWPANAATRINQANDVLASDAGRAAYDRLRAGSLAPRMPMNSLAAVLPRPTAQRNFARRRWVLGGAGLAALALTLTLGHWAGSPQGDEHLTQAAAAASPVADAMPGVPASPKLENPAPNRPVAALKPPPAPAKKGADTSSKDPKTAAVATAAAATPAVSSKSSDQAVRAAKETRPSN